MVDMGSVCGRYHKPAVVVCCCTSVQQCSVGLGGPDELVIATSYTNTSAMHCHHQQAKTLSLLSKRMSIPEQDQLAENTTTNHLSSSSSYINHYRRTSEDDHIQQCEQVGQDELVIAAAAVSSDNCYSQDYAHTIVCRYCREEVNSCYYEEHLVSCLATYQCVQGDCLDKIVQVVGRQVRSSSDNSFVVNCIAVQEMYEVYIK